MVEHEFLTPKECAEYRRCSERNQDRERAEGRGPPYVRDGRRILYPRADVDRYLAAHRYPGELRDGSEASEGTTQGPALRRSAPRRNARQ